jgi:hypothetical protein
MSSFELSQAALYPDLHAVSYSEDTNIFRNAGPLALSSAGKTMRPFLSGQLSIAPERK